MKAAVYRMLSLLRIISIITKVSSSLVRCCQDRKITSESISSTAGVDNKVCLGFHFAKLTPVFYSSE